MTSRPGIIVSERPQLHRYTFAPSSTRKRVRTGIARAAALARLCRGGLLDWRSAVSSQIAQRCMRTPAAEASLMRPSAGTLFTLPSGGQGAERVCAPLRKGGTDLL